MSSFYLCLPTSSCELSYCQVPLQPTDSLMSDVHNNKPTLCWFALRNHLFAADLSLSLVYHHIHLPSVHRNIICRPTVRSSLTHTSLIAVRFAQCNKEINRVSSNYRGEALRSLAPPHLASTDLNIVLHVLVCSTPLSFLLPTSTP